MMQIRTLPDDGILEDNAVLQIGVFLYAHAAEENGITDAAINGAAVGNNRVTDITAAFVVGRGLVFDLGINGRFEIEEGLAYLGIKQGHTALVIGGNRVDSQAVSLIFAAADLLLLINFKQLFDAELSLSAGHRLRENV